MKEESKLDNPVWFCLAETQARYGIDYDNVKCYHPDFCPFGGFVHPDGIGPHIDEYAALINNFFIVGQKPPMGTKVVLHHELICSQMIAHTPIEQAITEEIVLLNGRYEANLLQLINEVQPGYFRNSTSQLGNYYGIFKNGILAAVTGERMQMNSFIEVSAVVTHPGFTGRGYAKQLVALVANNIFKKNKIPFLHVSANNVIAIGLYQKLGFSIRRNISFWNFVTKVEG